MLARGSSSNSVTDSVVGYVPGGGNTVGEFSFGPDPCGSGGPNWACRGRRPPRNPIVTNAIIATESRAALFKVSLLKRWLPMLSFVLHFPIELDEVGWELRNFL